MQDAPQPPSLSTPPPDGVESATSGAEEPAYDLREFMNVNSNLLRMLSVLFATAAFLRASPRDNVVAILMFLTLLTAVVIYWRLWRDLAPELGILPARHWAVELTVFYYLFSISLVIAAYFLASEYLTRRHHYLWVTLGTVLALLAVVALVHWARAVREGGRWLGWVPGPTAERHPKLAGALVALLVLLSVTASYFVTSRLSQPVNQWLDQVWVMPVDETTRDP